jgi:hypothetical protein
LKQSSGHAEFSDPFTPSLFRRTTTYGAAKPKTSKVGLLRVQTSPYCDSRASRLPDSADLAEALTAERFGFVASDCPVVVMLPDYPLVGVRFSPDPPPFFPLPSVVGMDTFPPLGRCRPTGTVQNQGQEK